MSALTAWAILYAHAVQPCGIPAMWTFSAGQPVTFCRMASTAAVTPPSSGFLALAIAWATMFCEAARPGSQNQYCSLFSEHDAVSCTDVGQAVTSGTEFR